MQRVKLGLACLMCLFWVNSAPAQTALESDLGVATIQDYSGGVSYAGAYFDVRTMTGDGVGYRNGYTQLGGVLPVWVTPDMYVAPNVRLLITDNSEFGANVGGMVRRYSPDRDRIFGAYGYFDFDHSVESFDYSQVMFGFETLGQWLDARTNVYVPLSDDKNFVGPVSVDVDNPIFFGNALGFLGQALFQEALTGADFEFGAPLTKRTPWLRGFAGMYFYDAAEDDPIGFRGRIEANVSDDLSVGVNVSHDSNFGTNVNAVVDFRFAGWKPTRYWPQWTTRERMMASVQRNWRVATANTQEEVQVAGINPDTGNPYFVVWVDNSNGEPGDGTFENPFNYLPDSAPGADLILVRRGTTTALDPLSGSIALEDNQRFLGEGRAHQADIAVSYYGINFETTITLPGFADDGNYPYLTSPTSIVTLADNNEVSAFNFVRANGFAVTNDIGAGSDDFNLNHLNITGNGGGIFLANATGTGILDEINANNNTLGGISIGSGAEPLNLIGTNIVSSSLPAGNQTFGMRLTASTGTINASLTDVEFNRNVDGLLINGLGGDLNVLLDTASINDSTNDGLRISGAASDIAMEIRDTTINRSGGEGLSAEMIGGSLELLGRNLTANNSDSDNVNFDFTNSDFTIDIENAIFNSSNTGSGVVLNSTGGTSVGTMRLAAITASNNLLDGIRITGDDFADITAVVQAGSVTANGRDAFSVGASNSANVALGVTAVTATQSGRHGLNFNATTDGVIEMEFRASNLNFSGSDPALAGNGVNGFADDGDVTLIMTNTSAASSGNNGMFVVAQNDANVGISVDRGNFQNSGQNTAGADAVHIIADTDASVLLQIEDTPMNNTVPVPGGTQDDGLVLDASNSSTIQANVSNSNLSDNLSNAIQVTVDTDAAVALNLLNVTGERSGEDGILFDVQTGGAFALGSQTASFDDSGASGVGDGVDGFVRTGGVVEFNWVGTTVRRSAENGFLLDIADVDSSFVANIQSGNFSDSGEAELGVGQQDAFHILAADESFAEFNLVATPSANSFIPADGTQQRGLFANVTTGADVIFNNQSGDMSNNLLNALNVTVANAGSTAQITMDASPANNSGEDGFLFNVTDSGAMAATFTNSTLDNSGMLGGVGDDFDAIDGVIDTNGLVVLDFENTAVTNANSDGLQIVASNGATLLATFDNSPFDNSGTDNSGDAVRLTFSSGAQGQVALLNGSTATNAGDDAVFISATDVDTLVNFIAEDSDLSDSGSTATAGGGNGIRALVTNDAEVNLDIINTDITNSTPTLPQVRALYFEATAGATFTAEFTGSNLSGHDLDGIFGLVDGTGVADSSAAIALNDTIVDDNLGFGGIFTVTNEADLTIVSTGTSSISNNGATGLLVAVDGADSTFNFSFDGMNIDDNGALLGGDGMTVTADNGAAVFGEMNASSISNNANGGFTLLLDNASTADLGVTTAGFVDTTIDGNGYEGILATVAAGSELDLNMVGGSVSNNGILGTAGDLTDSYDNVRVEADTSDVEVQFVQTTVDGATRNGFNFIANDSAFLAQLLAGVSASGNTGGNGVRMVAEGEYAADPTRGIMLYMADTNVDGSITGQNQFNDNGTEPTLINTPTDPIDGFPQTGAGVMFDVTNVAEAAIRFSGDSTGNGNPADPLATRDIDGDGDGDDDGVYISIERNDGGTTLAAIDFSDVSSISGNVDQGIDVRVAAILGTINFGTVTEPSEINGIDRVVGDTFPGTGIVIEDQDVDGGGIDITLEGIDLAGNDIIIRNNSVTNSPDHGIELTLNDVTNIDEVAFENNVITDNALDGIHLDFTDSDMASMRFEGNDISRNGTAGDDGDGVGFDVIDNTIIGPVSFIGNTIDDNEFDGVSVDGVAPANGLWDFTFDGNTSISGNNGFGINFTIPDGAADLNLVMTDNAAINGNTAGGINIDMGDGNDLNIATFTGNTVSGNTGVGMEIAVGDGATMVANIGDTAGVENVFDGNGDAGLGVRMSGSATGSLDIANSSFTNSTNGADPDFNGDGVAVQLRNQSELTGSITGSTFSDNAGDGAILDVRGDDLAMFPSINNFTIGGPMLGVNTPSNTFANNGSNGLAVFRASNAQVNNFVIENSLFEDNTSDNILLTAANANTTDTYTITNNLIRRSDTGAGIHLDIRFDADLEATITGNVIGGSSFDSSPFTDVIPGHAAADGNAGDGILVTEQQNAFTDSRSVSGNWTANTIINNGGDGIELSGAFDGLVIGDAGGVMANGNLIRGNDDNGILVNNAGEATIGGNVIDQNGTNGTLGTASETAGVMLNLAPFTELNGNSTEVTVVGNVIAENFGDGVQYDVSEGFFGGALVQVNVQGNLIDSNAGRGIDMITRSSFLTRASITDNTVSGNGLEGVYIVNTPSTSQNQYSSAITTLERDGDLFAAPRAEIQFARNDVIGNGLNSPFSTTGLVVRVGTSTSSTSPYEPGGFAGTSAAVAVGANPFGLSTGFGGVVMTVDENNFSGNAGDDVLFHSYVATADPATSSGTWSATEFTVNDGYRSDPLARLDVYFRNNVADSLDVNADRDDGILGAETRNQGLIAYYNNAEGVFKSRLNSATPAGPFTSATRARNAQRQAGRLPFFTAPADNPALPNDQNYLYSGLGESTFRVTGDTAAFNTDIDPYNDTGDVRGLYLQNPITGELPYGWTIFP